MVISGIKISIITEKEFLCLFFREMKKGSGCNSCTHPTCPHSLNSTGISSCVECDGGVLVLDPASGPKWKLGCNRYVVILPLSSYY